MAARESYVTINCNYFKELHQFSASTSVMTESATTIVEPPLPELLAGLGRRCDVIAFAFSSL
jgi:hypothetical protein